MKLVIDAGNTRIKWALLGDDYWTHLPAVAAKHAHHLTVQIATLPEVSAVWVSNVAGAEVARHIQEACATRGWKAQFVRAQAQQCGVSNRYASPQQLGSDRWAALVAAWHRVGSAVLVVNCGTATTIDALSDQGEFMGGLILPGIALMQHSLVAQTAQLELGEGVYQAFPCNTADAILSGALQATCGAIQRQYALLEDARVPVLLGGGSASAVWELLPLPLLPVVDLVLQGLKVMAEEAGK